jgi:hypothetical protein
VLCEDSVAPALDAIEFAWKDRTHTPVVSLWGFLFQVLSADHSCRAAVARLLAHRVARGDSACSAEMGASHQARVQDEPHSRFLSQQRRLLLDRQRLTW